MRTISARAILILISLSAVSATETLRNHVPLQMSGISYMHQKESSNVFCKNYNMDFYLPIEDFKAVKSDFVITISEFAKVCDKLKQVEQCNHWKNLLWEQDLQLIETIKDLNHYITEAKCRNRENRVKRGLTTTKKN